MSWEIRASLPAVLEFVDGAVSLCVALNGFATADPIRLDDTRVEESRKELRGNWRCIMCIRIKCQIDYANEEKQRRRL